ncbi:hypothetical protein POVWA1_010970 [Plasmodium ovale wallikeri]|uniref:Uncharacterized protein n=1 Tax=Plasmodium ovale wallikeri TaxID=864142 RepID=A0A1A8YKY4_PLAOA|nr:hypothetical protein POVWA1_010970 [Plasmodium ovale wallikeri]
MSKRRCRSAPIGVTVTNENKHGSPKEKGRRDILSLLFKQMCAKTRSYVSSHKHFEIKIKRKRKNVAFSKTPQFIILTKNTRKRPWHSSDKNRNLGREGTVSSNEKKKETKYFR